MACQVCPSGWGHDHHKQHHSAAARRADLPSPTHDFDFLKGSFEVTNRFLVSPLTGSHEWKEFPATVVARTHLGGGVSVDEMYFPETRNYGLSFRVFDVESKQWSIYWVSSKDGRLGPPVRGVWAGDRCWLTGEDIVDGVAVQVSYSWSDVTHTNAHWEQAYSLDGETWEVNWTMDWVRRTDPPDQTQTGGPKVTSDFDFIVDDWQIDHRRLMKPLTGSAEWTTYSSPWTAWTYFNGAVTIDELGLADETIRGLTLRLFAPESKQWSIYWVNSTIGQVTDPVVGVFSGGTGIFEAPDVYDGRAILCRFVWSDITETTAKWRQEFSTDDGETWEANWYMDSTRLPSHDH